MNKSIDCMEQDPGIKQHDRETEAWKKIIGILQQENIIHKNKLAEMLKNHSENNETILNF